MTTCLGLLLFFGVKVSEMRRFRRSLTDDFKLRFNLKLDLKVLGT